MPNGELLPGAYAQVHLMRAGARRRDARAGERPALPRRGTARWRPSTPSNKVMLAPVTLGRDYGTVVEIITGLKPTDRVIDSPPDAILDGQTVRIAVRPTATPAAAATPSATR